VLGWSAARGILTDLLRWGNVSLMEMYQEKIAPPGPLPDSTEPTDVLSLNRTIESLKRENAWLKQQLERALRSK
jgi:hypothetical protein